MPPKKRTALKPKPTITVQPHLPLDLPTPTTTRNRQPRAQTTLSSRTTRQSPPNPEVKLSSTRHTRSVMQRRAPVEIVDRSVADEDEHDSAGSSSQEADTTQQLSAIERVNRSAANSRHQNERDSSRLSSEGSTGQGLSCMEIVNQFIANPRSDTTQQLSAIERVNRSAANSRHQNERDSSRLSSEESTGQGLSCMEIVNQFIANSRGAPVGPDSSGILTPLSNTSERPDYAYHDELDDEASTVPGSYPSYAGASCQDQQPAAAVSSSHSKRKRTPSSPQDQDTYEPPASQEPVKKAGKGKGKARATSQEIPERPAEAHMPPLEEPTPSYTAKGKGKGKARATSSAVDDRTVLDLSSASASPAPPPPPPPAEALATSQPLSSYTCPICFGAPTNATLTPCGHICCGACLFAAVKTTMARAMPWAAGPGSGAEARCPVCRAVIPHWDGKGRGVVGLQIRTAINI